MNTQNPLPSAWRWSLRYSPIMRVIRGIDERVRRRRLGAQTIAASGLPAPLQKRIAAIVGRTRLHASEQRDIARELISHCFEAIESAKDEPEILASLGDPKTIAPLLRRAAKRKRPLIYQLRRRAAQALLITFGLSILFYGLIAIRFYAGSPTIKTDYMAKINAPILAAPESDKAWPVYQQALIEWYQIEARLVANTLVDPDEQNQLFVHPGPHNLHEIPAGHPDREMTIEAMKAYRPTLDRVIDATRRPMIGMLLSDQTREIQIEGTDRTLTVTSAPSSRSGPLFQTLLPHLGQLRFLSKMLAFDSNIAIEEGDADRAAADIAALLRLSNQVKSEPFYISQLVSSTIYNFAQSQIHRLYVLSPGLLEREHVIELSHLLADARPQSLDMTSERDGFLDTLQRTFTDDGSGDGRMTPEGARFIGEFHRPLLDLGEIPELGMDSWLTQTSTKAAEPLASVLIASRAEQRRVYDELLAATAAAIAQGPQGLPAMWDWDTRMERLQTSPVTNWSPVSILTPSFIKGVSTVFGSQARTDATGVLLAADAYRLDHGAWPESLDLLVPRYLPAIPDDPFEPGASILYKTTPSGPTIWFRGADGDNDNARRVGASTDEYKARSFTRRYSQGFTDIPDADWVVFPPDLD